MEERERGRGCEDEKKMAENIQDDEMMAQHGLSMEMQISIAESSMFPGFKFSPTDDELISFYLKNRIEGSESGVQIIAEVDICKFEPWDLPAKSVIKSATEWFFFSPRGRKYPNGSQSRRATEFGYWKATGKERSVKSGSRVIGNKRTLVFHMGRAPRGERTEWIMHEYCMLGQSQDSLVVCRLKKNREFHTSDAQNQNALNQGNAPNMKNNYSAITEAGIEGMSLCDEERIGEGCSKTDSSSYGSYSVEQIASTSESKQKLRNDLLLQAECSGSRMQHEKDDDDDDDDDDCYADILKDDIIKLDETTLPPSDHQIMISKRSEERRKLKQPLLPFQGTARRRFKLNVSEVHDYQPVGSIVEAGEKVVPPILEAQTKDLWRLASGKMGGHRLMRVVSVALLLLLLLALLGAVLNLSSPSLF